MRWMMGFLKKANTSAMLVAALVLFVVVDGLLFYRHQLQKPDAAIDLGTAAPTAQRGPGTAGETAGQGSTCGGTPSESAFVQYATSENTVRNSTYLDNPLTDENPDAILFVTQNWDPGRDGGTYNDHPVGVWYDPDAQQWTIFNQDREDMPVGAAFNVMCG